MSGNKEPINSAFTSNDLGLRQPAERINAPAENRTVSLQPMFVTNRTTLAEIDDHLAHAETRIVVVTIEQSNTRGENIVDHVGHRYPDVRMVLVCEGSAADILHFAFKSGVWSCVSRQSSVETLRAAIDTVASGHRYLAPELIKNTAPVNAMPHVNMDRSQGFARDTMTPISRATDDHSLTRRERQVLSLIAQGHPRRDIAESLKVSPRTIDAYRARLLQKLNLDSSVQLVKYALTAGLAT